MKKLAIALSVLLILTPLAISGKSLVGRKDPKAVEQLGEPTPQEAAGFMIVDQQKYVNANNLLMFLTNFGVIASDAAGLFGSGNPADGLFYPYTSVNDILNGTNRKTVIFAGGLWLGGIVGADTLVTVTDWQVGEYVPGPMSGGTFMPDATTNPAYRVYKLYSDSMAAHPNIRTILSGQWLRERRWMAAANRCNSVTRRCGASSMTPTLPVTWRIMA